MSRARNIKPGFFKNDVLAECEPLARILFAGLWCEADRAGRLLERLKRLKADCLPYDDCNIEDLLGQLESKGFIVRYEVGGTRYIQVIEFAKHQNPHKNEAPSSLPAPELHGTSTVQAPEDDGSPPADSSLLFPDSLNPNGIDTHEPPTSAGEAALAMRQAGCVSINQSNPDFLAAIAQGVTATELADAVKAYRESIPGAGLFTYAVKAAITNHAKTAMVVVPTARAGPSAPANQSKTNKAAQNIQDTASELIRKSAAALGDQGIEHRPDEAADALLGRAAGA